MKSKCGVQEPDTLTVTRLERGTFPVAQCGLCLCRISMRGVCVFRRDVMMYVVKLGKSTEFEDVMWSKAATGA